MGRNIIVALVLFTCTHLVTASADDRSRRIEVKAKAESLFKNTTNHCRAFLDLVRFSANRATDARTMLEDLKLILIGKTLLQRGTGDLYIGNLSGARGDSGFKDYLRDGSPQVEHLMAAIYLAKMAPPFTGEIVALWYEGTNATKADVALWVLGLDLGNRVANRNFRNQFPKAIERTICK